MSKPKRSIENGGIFDMYYNREIKPLVEYLIKPGVANVKKKVVNDVTSKSTNSNYSGGRFEGAGYTSRWDNTSDSFNGVNFNQAYDAAVERNMPVFIFNKKLYNTKKENNPIREYNNRWVGQGRKQQKNPSKTYDRQSGPIRHSLSLTPVVTDTYNPNRVGYR